MKNGLKVLALILYFQTKFKICTKSSKSYQSNALLGFYSLIRVLVSTKIFQHEIFKIIGEFFEMTEFEEDEEEISINRRITVLIIKNISFYEITEEENAQYLENILFNLIQSAEESIKRILISQLFEVLKGKKGY